MRTVLEASDYVAAITPFYNGCKFRATFLADGSVELRHGCYLLVNLVQGASRVLMNRVQSAGGVLCLDVSPETVVAMKRVQRACTHCEGNTHEARSK